LAYVKTVLTPSGLTIVSGRLCVSFRAYFVSPPVVPSTV
jgi:hypothetical protein